MKNEAESWKKIYIGVIGGLLMLLPTGFFFMAWNEEINQLQHTVFKNKGNWLIAICFFLILGIMLHVFKGVKIGYYKIGSLLVSQLLSLICTHLIVTVQMILMIGKVALILRIVKVMLWLLVWNWVSMLCITLIFTPVYNILFPPYEILLIYGNYKNNLRDKILTRSDRYTIKKDMHFKDLAEKGINELLDYDGVILNDIPSKKKNEILKFCFDNGIMVYFTPKIPDIFVKEAEEVDVFDTPLFLCKNIGLSITQRIVKRGMDIVISIVVLILTFPLVVLSALAIKLEDGGSVIYSQERCSINGKTFRLYKLRSMKVNAESEGGVQLAKKSDSRITRTGSFLRMTRLDELPQLVNILRGDMSFVGPRPERPEFVEKNCQKIPEFKYRMKVKAGLTGYAQVYGKYNTSFLDKLKLDLLYIEKYSVLIDIQIILMTLKIILMKENAEGISE